MNNTYEKVSDDVIKNENQYFVRITSHSTIETKIDFANDENTGMGVYSKDITVTDNDNSVFSAVLITFEREENNHTVFVDMILSDFGNYISNNY